jgi:hyaluronan synthase
MLAFTRAALEGVVPFGIAGLLSWSIWLIRRALSHRATSVVNDFTTTTAVVVPVYREDAAILAECLATWVAEEPDELILVVDTEDEACLTMLGDADLPWFVRVLPFVHHGKRSALGVGIRAARSEVVVLCDSDTAWTPGLLAQIQMPFADPEVGGVGTRQTVAARTTSLWRRVASWQLSLRALDYLPALGAGGSVPCVSGRTAAYRRSVVAPLLPELEHERFLGRECLAGDDGRLTWLVLSAGYRTVHQASAHAVSMFPANVSGFLEQRVRWGRNSYRAYLTAAWNGWLWRQPFLTQVTVLQVLFTPLTMGIAMVYLARAFGAHPATGATYLGLILAGRAIRGLSHLREHPRDLALLPLVTLVTILLAVPVKLFAFATMNRQAWLTRRDDVIVAAGQDHASLDGCAVLS